MNSQLVQFKVGRRNLLKILETHSLKELNYIPKNFNNNLFWNVAHCLATQQLLHYYLSNNALKVNSFWVENFKKGTEAQKDYTQDQLDDLKQLLLSTANDLKDDVEKNIFRAYTNYSTSIGAELTCIEDAIGFNNMHEAIHLGYCMALKKNI